MTVRSNRVQRVERELLETLAQFLQHGLNEPLPCFASVTAVEVSPNLRHARVFFRLVGEKKHVAEAEALLEKDRHLFQKEVAREVKMKFVPVLRFIFGHSEKHDDVDRLLENLKRPKHTFGE
jgi:ribosome-binding factor A